VPVHQVDQPIDQTGNAQELLVFHLLPGCLLLGHCLASTRYASRATTELPEHAGQMRFHGPSDRNFLSHTRHVRIPIFVLRLHRIGPNWAPSLSDRRLTHLPHSVEQYFRRPGGTSFVQPERSQIIVFSSGQERASQSATRIPPPGSWPGY